MGRRSRSGSSSIGCLISLAAFVAALYYGAAIGELYWRQYQLLDELPPAARTFRITRGGNPRQIVIETQYRDSVNLFLLHRAFVFKPRAVEPL